MWPIRISFAIIVLGAALNRQALAQNDIPDTQKRAYVQYFHDTLDQLNQGGGLSNDPSCPDGKVEAELPGCSKLFESFCNELYSPAKMGNLDLELSTGKLPIRYGGNENGFKHTFNDFYKAQTAAKKGFPPELLKILESHGYFQMFESDINTNLKSLSRLEQLEREHFEQSREQIWKLALDEAALVRMEKEHPGYNQLKDLPKDWIRETAAARRKILFAANAAIWSQTPSWKKVQTDFENVRAEYIQMIQEEKALPEAIRREWAARLKSVKLELPATKDWMFSSYPRCDSVTENAGYDWTKNSVTFCAGMFNAQEMKATMAHELSHALGPSRTYRLFLTESDLGKKLLALKRAACPDGAIPRCPAEWPAFKQSLASLTKPFEAYAVQRPDFLGCLQSKKLLSIPKPGYFAEIARLNTNGMAAAHSEKRDFLNLTQPNSVYSNGKTYPNPDYLNSCGGQDSGTMERLGTDDNLEMFFTLEFSCSPSDMAIDDRITRSIEQAKKTQAQILAALYPAGGRFSLSDPMIKGGFSESVEERFADAMAYRVFARILKKIPSIDDRRKTFYANVANNCTPDGIVKRNPAAAEAEKKESMEPHPDGVQRRIESLVTPIQSALGCRKDFENRETVECPL